MKKKKEGNFTFGLDGILGGLANLVDKLNGMAIKGEELSKSGEFKVEGSNKDAKGICGFTIKVGIGEKGEGVKIEPFGNIHKDEETGHTVVQEIREPVVDVLEEKGHTLVVVEMPGIGAKDVELDVKDDLLTIYAEKGKTKYRKEGIRLPHSYPKEKMTVFCNNGIIEIKCILGKPDEKGR